MSSLEICAEESRDENLSEGNEGKEVELKPGRTGRGKLNEPLPSD
jgi:hypothetical protein